MRYLPGQKKHPQADEAALARILQQRCIGTGREKGTWSGPC
jgi:hypothetical protein